MKTTHKISRRTTGMREMNKTLQNEVLRSDLEQLEQRNAEFETRRRKLYESMNPPRVTNGWIDQH